MKKAKICVSENDRALLAGMGISGTNAGFSPDTQFMHMLQDELKKARVLPDDKMPGDVVTLNARVWITDLDSGETDRFKLVLPTDADGKTRISVLSPLGMALFGYSRGDIVEWGPVSRLLRYRIDEVRRNG